jgi:hypothetical protein
MRRARLPRRARSARVLLGCCDAALGWCGSRFPLLLGCCGHALGCCGSRCPQQRHLFWTHHYPRRRAADRRDDEHHGDPIAINNNIRSPPSLVREPNHGLFSKVPKRER